MESWATKPGVLVSGSAVGVYGNLGDQLVTEETSPNIEFTHELCRDWEQAALEAVSSICPGCTETTLSPP